MILQGVNLSERDITVTIQALKQTQDTGHAINGEQTHQSIIKVMPYEKSNQGTQTPNHTCRSK